LIPLSVAFWSMSDSAVELTVVVALAVFVKTTTPSARVVAVELASVPVCAWTSTVPLLAVRSELWPTVAVAGSVRVVTAVPAGLGKPA
jgi:hypothetical protein